MRINQHVTADDGSRIYYSVIGSERSGKKLFFVGGLFSNQATWLPFIAPFVQEYDCVLIDIRGHGLSEDKTLSPVAVVDRFARDVALVFDAEAGHENIMVSLSLGGNILLDCSRHIDMARVNRMILIETTMNPRLSDDPMNNTFRAYSQHIYADDAEMHRTVFPEIEKFESLLDVPQSGIDAMDYLLKSVVTVGGTGLYTRFGFAKKIPMWMRLEAFKIAVDFYGKWKSYACFGGGYFWDNEDYFATLDAIQTDVVMFVGMNNDFVDNEYNMERIKRTRPQTKFVRFEQSGHDLMVNEFGKFMYALKSAIRAK